jgi:hypothetical protein
MSVEQGGAGYRSINLNVPDSVVAEFELVKQVIDLSVDDYMARCIDLCAEIERCTIDDEGAVWVKDSDGSIGLFQERIKAYFDRPERDPQEITTKIPLQWTPQQAELLEMLTGGDEEKRARALQIAVVFGRVAMEIEFGGGIIMTTADGDERTISFTHSPEEL